ncbi:metallophosphoesterase family protein [Clostridium rhizosphaerae]|nr:metallophosphoesterase [Clostridium rhizosphaerae]
MKVRMKFLAAAIIASALSILIFTRSSDFLVSETVKTSSLPRADISFSVLGDIHEDTEKFQTAIYDLYKVRPNMDALVLNGDAVDQGLPSQYDSMKKLLSKNSSILPKTIIKNIGNHEFFDYKKEYNTAEDVKDFIGRYLQFAGEEKVYHDKWIKGFHFISLGSENGNTKDFNSVKAYISKEQLAWFKETIAKDYEKGRPIFVFLHQNLNSNASKGWVGTDQAEDIRKILAQYPEAILFTSHTHASLETTNVTLNQPFTMVHTGAVHYTLKIGSNGARERTDDNYGIYVEVIDNKVYIKGRDFNNKTWVFSKEIVNTK